jgi:hypothetical protein
MPPVTRIILSRVVEWSSALSIAAALLVVSQAAFAHGIAGNRFFLGTLTFDDPAVADEATVPNFSYWNHPDGGGDVTDNRLNYSFTRLLTPKIGVFVDNSWIARNWGVSQRFGFDTTNIGIKWEVYRDDPHEALLSASLAWGIGNTGVQAHADVSRLTLPFTNAIAGVPMLRLLRCTAQLCRRTKPPRTARNHPCNEEHKPSRSHRLR